MTGLPQPKPMVRVGCHIWAGPDLDDLAEAARQRPSTPEVWAPTDHPHLAVIGALWPNSTIRTIGPDAIDLHRPYVVHTHADPKDMEAVTLDRPRHTIVCPWPSASALSLAAPTSPPAHAAPSTPHPA